MKSLCATVEGNRTRISWIYGEVATHYTFIIAVSSATWQCFIMAHLHSNQQ